MTPMIEIHVYKGRDYLSHEFRIVPRLDEKPICRKQRSVAFEILPVVREKWKSSTIPEYSR